MGVSIGRQVEFIGTLVGACYKIWGFGKWGRFFGRRLLEKICSILYTLNYYIFEFIRKWVF